MFKKLTAPTLKQLFVQEMESMILSGELSIGEKLPPERELAQRMQISRSVVNDGIAEMARKGFLEITPRQGTYVADFHRNGTLDILVSIMSYNGGQLPRDEIRSILELRRVLMNFALESAIPLITPEQFSQLSAQCEAFYAAASPEEAANLIYEFDHMLSGFSGNTLLPLIFCSFRAPIKELWRRYIAHYGKEKLHTRNMELLRYIEEKDVDAAKRLIAGAVAATISGSTEIYVK
ncbi:MAG TPA: GntR family transcriptional regulator [Eubacteriales bacterium]|nr:GntR family transcriptional regulator [Eubacteriales bacterium]